MSQSSSDNLGNAANPKDPGTQAKDSGRQDLDELDSILFSSGVELNDEARKFMFEQYKMLLQSWEQLAARRQSTNGFFLSLNTFILAGVGFVFKESFEILVHEHRVVRLMGLAVAICLVGLAIDINWSKLIINYGRIIRSQLRVLEALERHIPAAIVTAQVAFHRKDIDSLSSLEANIAHTFQVIYVLAAVGATYIIVFPHVLTNVGNMPKQ